MTVSSAGSGGGREKREGLNSHGYVPRPPSSGSNRGGGTERLKTKERETERGGARRLHPISVAFDADRGRERERVGGSGKGGRGVQESGQVLSDDVEFSTKVAPFVREEGGGGRP